MFVSHNLGMKKSRFPIAIALLLIVGQLHTALHAAEFGGDIHHHDGVLCLTFLPEDEYDIFVQPQSSHKVFSHKYISVLKPSRQLFSFFLLRFLPPHTGPPNKIF